jgi:hypothetical protein
LFLISSTLTIFFCFPLGIYSIKGIADSDNCNLYDCKSEGNYPFRNAEAKQSCKQQL